MRNALRSVVGKMSLVGVAGALALAAGGCLDCANRRCEAIKSSLTEIGLMYATCCQDPTSPGCDDFHNKVQQAWAKVQAVIANCNNFNDESLRTLINDLRALNLPERLIQAVCKILRVDCDPKQKGGMVNPTSLLLRSTDQVQLAFVASRSTTGTSVSMITLPDGYQVLPEAFGAIAVGLAGEAGSATVEGTAVPSAAPGATPVWTYSIPTSGAISIDSLWGVATYATKGSFAVTVPALQSNGSKVGTPTAFSLTLDSPQSHVKLKLDPSFPQNHITINPDGSGVIEAAMSFSFTTPKGVSLEGLVEQLWVRLPFQTTDGGVTLDFSALGILPGTEVLPVHQESIDLYFPPTSAEPEYPPGHRCEEITDNGVKVRRGFKEIRDLIYSVYPECPR